MMGRISYVCAECSEHFTRKTSGERHNLNLHYGRAEIVPLMEYLAGRNSGKYTPSHPSWFKGNKQNWMSSFHSEKNHSVNKVVWDSIGGQSAPIFIKQQDTLYDMNSFDHAILRTKFRSKLYFRSFLPLNTMHLLLELETLLYKHPNYYDNPALILQNAVNQCSSGNDKFLFGTLDIMRKLDSLHI